MISFRKRMHLALDKVMDADTEQSLKAEVEEARKQFHQVMEAAQKRGASDYTPEERAVREKFKNLETKLAELRKASNASSHNNPPVKWKPQTSAVPNSKGVYTKIKNQYGSSF